jgi:hypothetical protein
MGNIDLKKIEEEIKKVTEDYILLFIDLFEETKQLLSPIVTRQLQLLLVNLASNKKDFVTIYTANQILSYWNDFDFLEYVLKYKQPQYSTLVSRMIIEKMLRLQFLFQLTPEEQLVLCKDEYMRTAKRYHRNAPEIDSKLAKLLAADFKRLYSLPIENYKPNRKHKFPSMIKIMMKLFPDDYKDLYFIYSDFSELIHGNIPVNYIYTKNNINFIATLLGLIIENTKATNKKLEDAQCIVLLDNALKLLRPEINKIQEPDLQNIIKLCITDNEFTDS